MSAADPALAEDLICRAPEALWETIAAPPGQGPSASRLTAVRGQPRWRFLRPGPPGLAWVLLLVHGPAAETSSVSVHASSESPALLSLLGARATDLALVSPDNDPGEWNNADLLFASCSLPAERVRRRLGWLDWRECGAIDLRLSGSGSWFRPLLEHYRAVYAALLDELLLEDAIDPSRVAGLRRRWAGRELRLAHAARRTVLGALDHRTLGALSRAGVALHVPTYNYLASGGRRRRREQALRQARGVLAASLPADQSAGLRDATTSIDRGRPVLDALGEWYETAPDTINRVARSPLRASRIEGAWHVRAIASSLDLVAPSEHPSTRHEWEVFAEAAVSIQAVTEALAAPDQEAAACFLENALRPFLAEAAAAGWMRAAERWPEMFRDRRRMLGDVFFRLDHCAEALQVSAQDLQRALCQASVPELIALGAGWEAALRDLAPAYMQTFSAEMGTSDYTWEPLTPSLEMDGFTVAPLHSASGLARAAAQEGYWVVHQLPALLFAGEHWVWIHGQQGERRSLIELACLPESGGTPRVRLVSHRLSPFGSSEVPIDCVRTARAYLSRLRAAAGDRLRVAETERQARIAQRATIEAALGHADRRVLREALSRTLPRRIWTRLQKARSRSQSSSHRSVRSQSRGED